MIRIIRGRHTDCLLFVCRHGFISKEEFQKECKKVLNQQLGEKSNGSERSGKGVSQRDSKTLLKYAASDASGNNTVVSKRLLQVDL